VALKAMHKDHNMMVPIMEAIKTLNNFGMEVVSGIILGLDTDKPETGAALLEFIDASQIPLLTINLLQALPNTPLWDRLKRENRLLEDEGRESNVDFRLPYEDVVKTWRACMGSAYQPAKLLERYEYQIRETYSNWIKRPRTPQQKSWANIKLGLTMLRNIFWKVGILGDYKIEFWKFALRRIARGEIEFLISSILVAHHLINFARAASGGHTNASYYSLKLQEASVPAE
jgi:hopanoid C-2 methylase